MSPVYTVVDNGDESFTLSGDGISDNGDETYTLGVGVGQFSQTTITFEGVDVGVTYASGLMLVFDTVTGWFSGPGSRSNFTDRPQDHGSFDGPVYRTSRVVTVSGWAYADSRQVVASAIHSLTGILAEGQMGTVTVSDPDYGSLSVQARLTDGPLIGWDDYRNAWTWQIQVTAPDPRKYGSTVTASTALPAAGSGGLVFPLYQGTGKLEYGTPGTSGRVTVTNNGTADAYQTFTITGPVLGGVVLTDVTTGRQIVYANDVPASGVLLVIDSATGRATLNGSDRTSELTVKQWTAVKAGASATTQFSTLGAAGQAGSLTVSLAPAYW